MVRPCRFAGNEQTAATNRFQTSVPASSADENAEAAQREFDAVANNLASHGIQALVFEGNSQAMLPDEVFANNWISTHADGTVVIYPMLASNRRQERREDIVTHLRNSPRFSVTRIVDLSRLEADNEFLEGTGSVVIDHRHRTAYCALSCRSTPAALACFAEELALSTVSFTSEDSNGAAVYHTNVMMALGPEFAVACLESIADDTDRQRIHTAIETTGRTVIEITRRQMHDFCGNILALSGTQGPVIALSQRALANFSRSQAQALERFGTLVATDIKTIETLGGGSIRCMLTEILLPTKELLAV
jgi:hypothetical protein